MSHSWLVAELQLTPKLTSVLARAAIIIYQGLSGLNNRPWFLEAEKFGIRVPACSASDESPFPGSQTAAFMPSCCVFTWRRETESEREHMKWVLVSSSFYKGTNLIEGALTSWPESPPGGFISNTTTMGIRVSTYGPWRDKNIGSVTTLKPTCSMGNPRWSRRHQVLVHFFSIVE